MNKGFGFRYVLPIYGYKFYYSEGQTPEEFSKLTRGFVSAEQTKEDDGTYKAITYINRTVAIRFTDIKDFSIPVLAHEVFHAVVEFKKNIGANLTKDSEEDYAYLIEHLMELILKRRKVFYAKQII